MRDDPLYPVLNAQNYAAIDRRLGYIIQVIQECLTKSKNSVHDVLRNRFDNHNIVNSGSNVRLRLTIDDIQNASCLIEG
jgi:hypothetical protein